MAVRSMTGQAFFVLTALASGPRQGYGIVGEVAELSQGRVQLKIGVLYGVLDRLAADGLIEPDREEARDGRLRRYYRLTRDGRGALAAEADLRAATARVVRARLGLAGRRSPAWSPWPPGCTWAARARRAGTSPGGRPCGSRCSRWCWCTRRRAWPAHTPDLAPPSGRLVPR